MSRLHKAVRGTPSLTLATLAEPTDPASLYLCATARQGLWLRAGGLSPRTMAAILPACPATASDVAGARLAARCPTTFTSARVGAAPPGSECPDLVVGGRFDPAIVEGPRHRNLVVTPGVQHRQQALQLQIVKNAHHAAPFAGITQAGSTGRSQPAERGHPGETELFLAGSQRSSNLDRRSAQGGFLPVRFRASMLQKRMFDIWRDLADSGTAAYGR